MPQGRESMAADGDRLGDLPDGVLEHLISFLPSRDAVRTCVLARRWRGLWLRTRSLRVDELSVEDTHRFLDHLFLLRGHAPIDTCDLSFSEFSNRDVPYLNLWIRYALMCRVRALRFYPATWTCDGFFPVDDLPLITSTLTKLKLYGVDLRDRTTDFSSCPVLEVLKLWDCNLSTKAIASNSLKRLSLTYCYIGHLHCRARISTPNLVWLKIDDLGGHFPLLGSMPCLVTAFVRVGGASWDYCKKTDSWGCSYEDCDGCVCAGKDADTSVLLDGLSSATNLELITNANVFIFMRDLQWCPTFSKLKSLVLNEWCIEFGLQTLGYIFQHTPVLQKLTIQLCEYVSCLQAVKQKAQNTASHSPMEHSLVLKHLKRVEVKCPMVDYRVRTILRILETFGIPLDLIDIQQTSRNARCFSFEETY